MAIVAGFSIVLVQENYPKRYLGISYILPLYLQTPIMLSLLVVLLKTMAFQLVQVSNRNLILHNCFQLANFIKMF